MSAGRVSGQRGSDTMGNWENPKWNLMDSADCRKYAQLQHATLADHEAAHAIAVLHHGGVVLSISVSEDLVSPIWVRQMLHPGEEIRQHGGACYGVPCPLPNGWDEAIVSFVGVAAEAVRLALFRGYSPERICRRLLRDLVLHDVEPGNDWRRFRETLDKYPERRRNIGNPKAELRAVLDFVEEHWGEISAVAEQLRRAPTKTLTDGDVRGILARMTAESR